MSAVVDVLTRKSLLRESGVITFSRRSVGENAGTRVSDPAARIILQLKLGGYGSLLEDVTVTLA